MLETKKKRMKNEEGIWVRLQENDFSLREHWIRLPTEDEKKP